MESFQAFQVTAESRADTSNWPQWLRAAWKKEPAEVGAVWPNDFPKSDGTDKLVVTCPGRIFIEVRWGDYIVCHARNRLRVSPKQWFEFLHVN